MEKASQRVKISRDDILAARAIYNFPSCYMKNALVFSRLEARYFFMYFIMMVIRRYTKLLLIINTSMAQKSENNGRGKHLHVWIYLQHPN